MKKGFTLIELLVVVAVIGILSAITLSVINVQRVRNRAQDSVRREALATLSGALERYYSENNAYPPTGSINLLVPDYIRAIPTDPTGGSYSYGSNAGQTFCVCANLQAETTPDIKGCTIAGTYNYCVVNPF